MAMKVNNEASAKVVMLGDSLVGKTCLTILFVRWEIQ